MIVLIPTCERPALFARLVRQLTHSLGPQDRVIVHDDGSTPPYVDRVLSSSTFECPYTVMRSSPRMGLRGYWRTVELLLAAAEQSGADPNEPILYLADDLVMAPDWFIRSIALLDRHAPSSPQNTPRSRCLGVVIHTDYRQREWGLPCEPYDKEGDRLSWMDGAFLTRHVWIPFLPPGPITRNWDSFPLFGSGVWHKTSQRTHMLGLWWYRPYISLSLHDDEGKSMINHLWNGRRPFAKTRGVDHW